MEKGILKINAEKISRLSGLTPEEVAVIKVTIAKNVNDTELAYFLSFAKSIGLNPFNKECWCYKDHKGNLIVFAGRDGFLKIGQKDSRWNGMISAEVRSKDEFSIDYFNEKPITHRVKDFKDRGEIIGAYAFIKPKECELPTVGYVDYKTYFRGGGPYKNVWDSHPAAMIKKVAEVQALKKHLEYRDSHQNMILQQTLIQE